jgi:hypothetical protein
MPVIGLTESFRCWAIRRFGQTKRRFSENGFDFRRDDADRSELHDASTGYYSPLLFYKKSGGSPMAVSLLFEPTYKR